MMGGKVNTKFMLDVCMMASHSDSKLMDGRMQYAWGRWIHGNLEQMVIPKCTANPRVRFSTGRWRGYKAKEMLLPISDVQSDGPGVRSKHCAGTSGVHDVACRKLVAKNFIRSPFDPGVFQSVNPADTFLPFF